MLSLKSKANPKRTLFHRVELVPGARLNVFSEEQEREEVVDVLKMINRRIRMTMEKDEAERQFGHDDLFIMTKYATPNLPLQEYINSMRKTSPYDE